MSSHTVDQTVSGVPRSRPYEVRAHWYDVGGQPSMFVYGRPAQTPFGLVSDLHRREIGATIVEVYRDGR